MQLPASLQEISAWRGHFGVNMMTSRQLLTSSRQLAPSMSPPIFLSFLYSLSTCKYTLTWCVSNLNHGWRFHVHLSVQLKWYRKVRFCHDQSILIPTRLALIPSPCLPSIPWLVFLVLYLVSISDYEKIFWSSHLFLPCFGVSSSCSKVSKQFRPSSRCVFIALVVLGTSSCRHERPSPGVIQNGPIWADWTRGFRVCSSGHLQLRVTDSEKSRSLVKDGLVENGILATIDDLANR